MRRIKRKMFCVIHGLLNKIYFNMPIRKIRIFIIDLQIRNGIFWDIITKLNNANSLK